MVIYCKLFHDVDKLAETVHDYVCVCVCEYTVTLCTSNLLILCWQKQKKKSDAF